MCKNNGSNLLAFGDHIIVYRESARIIHHGIYVGENKGTKSVIHFISPEEKNFLSTMPEKASCETCEYTKKVKNGGVVKSCLGCFIAGCPMNVKEYANGSFKPCNEVVYIAYDLLQNGFGQHGETSEDFAILCKTGISRNFDEVVTASATTVSVFGGFF